MSASSAGAPQNSLKNEIAQEEGGTIVIVIVYQKFCIIRAVAEISIHEKRDKKNSERIHVEIFYHFFLRFLHSITPTLTQPPFK